MEIIRDKIDKSKVDFFIAANADKFDAASLKAVRETLSGMTDEQFMMIQGSGELRDPTLMLVVSLLLGWDRFFLDDIAMGLVKIITCGGFGIWWLIDLFTVIDRTKQYNFRRLMQITSYIL
jgi:TM2 domain-containing membrane protein YozV